MQGILKKIILEHLVEPKSKEVLKEQVDGGMSKGHRIQLKQSPKSKAETILAIV